MTVPQPTSGEFRGTLLVHPPTNLNIDGRSVGGFVLHESTDGNLSAASSIEGASQIFQSGLANELRLLSIDLIWERCIAVEFEPSGGQRVSIQDDGTQLVHIHVHETINATDGNPRHGVTPNINLGLLPEIRDRIINHHLASGDSGVCGQLMGDAALLLSIEHFVKGVVNRLYSLPEFYLVLESVSNHFGSRRELEKALGFKKSELDPIARVANDDQKDSRHAPKDASTTTPVTDMEIADAARVANEIIDRYSRTLRSNASA